MSRWLASLLVLGFALLVGVAGPTLACAAAMAERDCCPPGTTAPCGGDKSIEVGSLAACCVGTPTAPAAALGNASRNTHDQAHDSGSPTPILALAWFATFSASAQAPYFVPPPVSRPRTDAALTYLRTGRLRL